MLAQFEPGDAGQTFAIPMRVTDASGLSQTIETFNLTAQYRDTAVPAYGPNKAACAHGVPLDSVPFDRRFECNCNGTVFEGANVHHLLTRAAWIATAADVEAERSRAV